MWRDDRAISGILEELIALAVVSIAICLLLVSISSTVATQIEHQRTIEMRAEVTKLLRRVVSHPRLTREGEHLLLDWIVLRNASADLLGGILRTRHGFRVLIQDVTNSSNHVIGTSVPVGDLMSATTSCNIWVGPGDIHAARLTLVIWEG
ncbi:MAG: hypothetical protein ACE5QF_02415 [Thermoplasmata archaeon]